MAIVKALRRLAGGGFSLISASDQIACDAGAMTVTPTGGAQQSVPDAIGGRVLADANNRVPASKLGLIDTQNLLLNPNFAQGTEDWAGFNSTVTTLSNGADLPAGAPALNAAKIARTTLSNYVTSEGAVGGSGLRGTPCTSDDRFYAEAWVYSNVAGSVYFQVIGRTTANVEVGGNTPVVNVPAAVWTKVSASPAPAANGVTATLRVANSANNSTLWVTNVRFQRRNAAALIVPQGIVPEMFFAPTRGQFFRALENSGAGRVAAVSDTVPSDRGDAINIAFNHTTFVTQAGALAQFVKTTLGLTDAQIASIITAARSVAE